MPLLTDSTILPHIHRCLTHFTPLCIPTGLAPFSKDDFLTYLSTPTQFEFSLKKEKGQNILYAQAHIHARQQFFNGLPQEFRIKIFLEKLTTLSTLDCFKDTTVTDVQDIGAGHSIYVLTLDRPYKNHLKWVIKQEELPNQSLMCELLRALNWPSYLSFHAETPTFNCEISQYLGHQSLWKSLQIATPKQKEKLETQLAQHAALGNILGRGDRHMNNYMVSDQFDLLPIDISFLFWEGNEDWDYKYIAGGMYEFSMLAYEPPATQPDKIKRFFETYLTTLHTLKTQQPLLENHLLTFFANYKMDAKDKLHFIQTRLNNLETYFHTQKKRYIEALTEMEKRLKQKEALQAKVKNTPEVLSQNPLLKMYYLTDLNQPSCFFLLEHHPQLTALFTT